MKHKVTRVEQHWFWSQPDFASKPSKHNSFNKGISEWYYFTPDINALQEKLAELISIANKTQKEITAVVPLQGSHANTYMQSQVHEVNITNHSRGWGWGLGAGFGATFTGGLLVILKETKEVSKEEYDVMMAEAGEEEERIRRDRQIEENRLLHDRLQSEIESLEANELKKMERFAQSARNVNEHKKLMGGRVFKCGGEEFDTYEEAELHRKKIQEELASLKEHIDALREKADQLEIA